MPSVFKLLRLMHEIKNKKITADPLIEYVISSGIIHHLALHLLMYPGFSQKWKRVGSEEDVLNEWKSMRSTYQSGANQHMSAIYARNSSLFLIHPLKRLN